jgi:hypothetical protein
MIVVSGSPAARCDAQAPIMLMRIPAYAHSLRRGTPGVRRAAAARRFAVPRIVAKYGGYPRSIIAG